MEPAVLAQGSSATQKTVRAGRITRLPQDPGAELLDLGFVSGSQMVRFARKRQQRRLHPARLRGRARIRVSVRCY